MQQFHTKGRENSGNYACSPPFHEPFPLTPSFSPSGGEGARRAVEGDSDRFMASIHVRILEVFATHEPSSPPVQPFVAYATKGCCRRFLASMRDFEIVGATHEPGGARLRRALISVVGRSGLDGVSPHPVHPIAQSRILLATCRASKCSSASFLAARQ